MRETSTDESTGSTEGLVAQANDHPALEWGARLGYAAKGVLHLLLAYLTVQIAFPGGGENEQASSSGALSTIAQQPAGQVALWVLVVGFALLALWELTEVVLRDEAFDKAKAAGLMVVYATLVSTSFTFASGGSTSSNEKTKDYTATLMDAPAGQVLVALVGVAILAVAGYHVHKGWTEKFLDNLDEHPGRWAVVAGKVGYLAKGVALIAVGVLFVVAAITHESGKATGLDGGLESLRGLPAGPVILLAIAAGLAAYAVYCFARARYARL